MTLLEFGCAYVLYEILMSSQASLHVHVHVLCLYKYVHA